MTAPAPPVSRSSRSVGAWTSICLATGFVALAVGLWVRGVEGRPLPRLDVEIEDGEEQPNGLPQLEEPIQFLSPGALTRVSEFEDRISTELREDWLSSAAIVFSIKGCPKLLDWFNAEDGLAFERHLAQLRMESRESALASLCLYFALARATEWEPGLLARIEHAEKLGAQLEEWLFVWGEESATDPLLFEPALGALLLYGKVMHVAYDAPLMSYNDAALERARVNLTRLLGRAGERTALGRAVQDQYPRAVAMIETEEAVCKGLAEECETKFPDLDGACEEE